MAEIPKAHLAILRRTMRDALRATLRDGTLADLEWAHGGKPPSLLAVRSLLSARHLAWEVAPAGGNKGVLVATTRAPI